MLTGCLLNIAMFHLFINMINNMIMNTLLADSDLTSYTSSRIQEVAELQTYFKNNSIFSLFHNNIRSLQRNFEDLQILLCNINIEFDVIALTESWVLNEIEHINLINYDTVYNYGNINKNDGVVAFINSHLNYNVEIINIGVVKCLRICINKQRNILYLTVLYRPPSLNVAEFIGQFDNYLETCCVNQNEVIVGDININLLNENDRNTTDYLNILYAHGFVSCINDYTREQNNHKACLDHIFIKTQINKNKVIPLILETTITDHFAVLLNIEGNTMLTNNNSWTISKKMVNYESLRHKLKIEKWEILHDKPNDVNFMTETFVATLKRYIENCTYYKPVNRHCKKRRPWITTYLIGLVNKRNEMYNKHKREKTMQTWEQYKRFRNKVNNLIKKSKHNYYKIKIGQNAKDSKFIWNTIRDSFNMKKGNKQIEAIKDEEGRYINNKEQIAEEFNRYFVNIAGEMANKIPQPLFKAEFKEKHCEQTIFLKPVDRDEINKYILQLKTNAAPGIDDINTRTLQEIKEYINPILVNIINTSFVTGVCPNHFKISTVTPVYKQGNKDIVENYRPISLVSNLSKIFEKALKCRLIEFWDMKSILSNAQFGFRKKRAHRTPLQL